MSAMYEGEDTLITKITYGVYRKINGNPYGGEENPRKCYVKPGLYS